MPGTETILKINDMQVKTHLAFSGAQNVRHNSDVVAYGVTAKSEVGFKVLFKVPGTETILKIAS